MYLAVGKNPLKNQRSCNAGKIVIWYFKEMDCRVHCEGCHIGSRKSNELGMSVIVNYLGEENLEPLLIRKSVSEYLILPDLLNANNILGCISIKPSQVGLAINYELCLRNIYEISEYATNLGRFVWIDMESLRYVEDTISIYLDIFKKNRRTGLVIQSYLRRSHSAPCRTWR